jgi:hypothetical protein
MMLTAYNSRRAKRDELLEHPAFDGRRDHPDKSGSSAQEEIELKIVLFIGKN